MKSQKFIKRLANVLLILLCSPLLVAAPTTLTQSVSYDGKTLTMQLTRQDLRGAHFELWAQNSSGGYDVITPVEERSYIGTVDEDPAAICCGILQDDGQFRGAVYFDRGPVWFTLGAGVTGTRGFTKPYEYAYPQYNLTPGQAGSTMYGFDVGVDVTYDYFNVKSGGDIAKTFENIEFSVTATRAIYMRDVLLKPSLGRVIIRANQSQDPYAGLTGGTYLTALRSEWNTNQTDADRDLVCGVTDNDVGGGLAWAGVVGTVSGYSVNDSGSDGNFSVFWRHEMGHNWGCGHYDGGAPELRTIMSNNLFGRFSCGEARNILRHRDAKLSHLDDLGTYTAVELHPYACLDECIFNVGIDKDITIDVLANDHDGNGDTLSLLSFDAISDLGGSVKLSSGTGPDGRDELIYTAPSNQYNNLDSFYYEVQDSTGQTQSGIVVVAIELGNSLQLYWPLDETSGTVVSDQTVFHRDGTAMEDLEFSDSNSVPGQYATAIHFDGIDDYVQANNLPADLTSYTITLWAKADFTGQSTYTSVLNNNSSGADFQLEADGWTYEYNGIGGSATLGTIKTDWVHLAITCDGATTRLYYNGAFVTSIATADNDFGTLIIGANRANDKHFAGAIDEVRLYNYQLSDTQITDIYNGDIAVGFPMPFDGQGRVGIESDFAWCSSPVAVQYHVYLGTDQTAVRNANTGSPEYLGATTDTTYSPTLYESTTYYWRVDTETASGAVTGPIWSFTTRQAPVVIMDTNLDDASTSGTQLTGVTWTQDASAVGIVNPDSTIHSLETHNLRNDLNEWIDNVAVDYNLNSNRPMPRGIIASFSVTGALDLADLVIGHTHTSNTGTLQAYGSDMTVTLTNVTDSTVLYTDTTYYDYNTSPKAWQSHAYDMSGVSLEAGKAYAITLTMQNMVGGGAYAAWNEIKLFGIVPEVVYHRSDINEDGDINLQDFAEFAGVWLVQDCSVSNPSCGRSDIDADNDVDFDDLLELATSWLAPEQTQ